LKISIGLRRIKVSYTAHVTGCGFLRRVTKRHKETKRSVLMSKKENSFAGQPVASWERKNGDQCFGGEKELDDRGRTSGNRFITDEEDLDSCIQKQTSNHSRVLMRQWNMECAGLRHL